MAAKPSTSGDIWDRVSKMNKGCDNPAVNLTGKKLLEYVRLKNLPIPDADKMKPRDLCKAIAKFLPAASTSSAPVATAIVVPKPAAVVVSKPAAVSAKDVAPTLFIVMELLIDQNPARIQDVALADMPELTKKIQEWFKEDLKVYVDLYNEKYDQKYLLLPVDATVKQVDILSDPVKDLLYVLIAVQTKTKIDSKLLSTFFDGLDDLVRNDDFSGYKTNKHEWAVGALTLGFVLAKDANREQAAQNAQWNNRDFITSIWTPWLATRGKPTKDKKTKRTLAAAPEQTIVPAPVSVFATQPPQTKQKKSVPVAPLVSVFATQPPQTKQKKTLAFAPEQQTKTNYSDLQQSDSDWSMPQSTPSSSTSFGELISDSDWSVVSDKWGSSSSSSDNDWSFGSGSSSSSTSLEPEERFEYVKPEDIKYETMKPQSYEINAQPEQVEFKMFAAQKPTVKPLAFEALSSASDKEVKATSLSAFAKAHGKQWRSDSPLAEYPQKACHSKARGDNALSKKLVDDLYETWFKNNGTGLSKKTTMTDKCEQMKQWSINTKK